MTPLGADDTVLAEKAKTAIVVDGERCTMRDAILAANAGGPVGGCYGSAGADLILLDAEVVLNEADSMYSSLLAGGYAGLPDVTSAIRIEARAANRIARQPRFGCVGDPAFRLLTVRDGGVLVLSGLELSNGCVRAIGDDVGGGAVLAYEASLALEGVTITDSAAVSTGAGEASGGAVAAISGDGSHVVDLRTSALVHNRAESAAGDAAGGALAVTGSGITIRDAIFFSNWVLAGAGRTAAGGALALDTAHAGAFELLALRENRAEVASGGGPGGTAKGGAIHTTQPIGRLADSELVANVAVGGDSSGAGGHAYGGALDGQAVLIERTSFVDNTARGGAGNPGGAAQGGGLAALAPTRTSTLFNATFARNSAIAGGGGHAAGGGLATTVASWFDLRNATFAGNSAEADAGGSAAGGWAFAASATFGARSSLFADNQVVTEQGVTPVDCDAAARIDSYGYNLVRVNGGCSFTPTDRVGHDPRLSAPANNGCTSPFLDGSCLLTVAFDEASPAIDRGHCLESGVSVDARGFPRPIDISSVHGPGDECDPGAFEYDDTPKLPRVVAR